MIETALLEQKTLREEAAKHIEVLEKVKHLLLIPEMEVMTTKQVADYYDCPLETVLTCYKRNKEEIDLDGVINKSLADFKEVHFEPIRTERSKTLFKLADGITLEVPNRGIRCFTKRAILRIGMLLRESPVAKEVRTQLLNVLEASSPEQRTKTINEELERLTGKIDSFETSIRTMESSLYDMINYSTINSRQAQKLFFCAKDRVSDLLGGAHSAEYKAKSKMYFQNLWNSVKFRFGVGSYKDLNPLNYPKAMEFISQWTFVER